MLNNNTNHIVSTTTRKKLYKAKKNWLVATAITAGVMGGAILGGTTVHADEVNQPATNTTGTVQLQSENQNSAAINQASQAVQDDQTQLQSANSTLNQQQAQLSDA